MERYDVEIFSQVTEILAQVCGEPQILENPEIELIETGLLDSLALIELLAVLEDRFELELSPSRIDPIIWHKAETIAKLVEEQRKWG